MKTKLKTTSNKHNKKTLNYKKISAKKVLIKKNRPVHKKLALHPLSIMFLLCLGVILVISTLSTLADSYTVNATVPNPPGPSQPATINNPINGQHFTSNTYNISGTCPTDQFASVYVELVINNVVGGYSPCSYLSYQIAATLNPGSNQIQAKIFDSYNTPGPVIPGITIFYDTPVSIPPIIQPVITPALVNTQSTNFIALPIGLQILQLDNNTPYIAQSAVQEITNQPTITGTSPPYSHIIITIHTIPYTCVTDANSQGFWQCRLHSTISMGIHHVEVVATTPKGVVLTINTFPINVDKIYTPIYISSTKRFNITSVYKYLTFNVNQVVSYTINSSGGHPPYAFIVNWGDAKTDEITRIKEGSFVISHTYSPSNKYIKNMTVKIGGIDSYGSTTSLQLFAPIINPVHKNFASYVGQGNGFWSIFSGIGSWLWIIWPAYIVIILMIFSFWLGEKQEIINLINRNYNKSKRRKVAVKHH